MESTNEQQEKIISDLMDDVNGMSDKDAEHKIESTIKDILHKYNLSTDLSFIEKVGNIKFGNKKDDIDLSVIPQDLKDAAFLPVNTIAEIALRQDIELMVSQIPEWHTELEIVRDAICEADIVTGQLARSISFENVSMTDDEKASIMRKIESVEDKLDMHTFIKNHAVYNADEQGESYVYLVPYAKVFDDLYKYRINSIKKSNKNVTAVSNMFETSSTLKGYGYGESAIEVSLSDVSVIQESNVTSSKNKSNKRKSSLHNSIFTEQEIMEINPGWDAKYIPHENDSDNIKKDFENNQKIKDEEYDNMLKMIGDNIRYISDDIALPVIEESAMNLTTAYDVKYGNNDSGKVKTIFESVMNDSTDVSDFNRNFSNVKGVYMKIMPATKLIPIRVDRTVIGYYYISDLTRPEENGKTHNSGLSGYTLRTPSIGYDTFSPDRVFCEKMASKIINNFDLKFMRDNTALHEQIVAILQSHKFNESLMRFIFIPAEHIVQFSINKDGEGRGHSILEPGLVKARMYMFLELYSILYQINNAEIRVYNLRSSGIDTNYKQFVQQTMRKFAARRITANDIFNYRSSMTKVSGGSELIMPMGANNEPPITVDKIDAANAPINSELKDSIKHEVLNSSPVPSAMVTGGASEMEFAKEVEWGNTRLNSFVSSLKIELNRDVTTLYRRVLRWETDIDPEILASLKFQFRQPAAKHLNVTNEMIQNFNAITEVLNNTFLSKKETAEDNNDGSIVVREYQKLLIQEYLPQFDIGRLEELANEARKNANRKILDDPKRSGDHQNILDDEVSNEEGMV